MVIADNDYPMGTAMHMAPGNFPAALGLILGLFGIFLTARGLGWPEKTPAPVVPVDVYLCAVLGALGYVLAKLECEPAPPLLGYVLGPLFEEHLRRAMLLARGDPSQFFTRPISLAFMLGTALVLAVMIAPALRRGRHPTWVARVMQAGDEDIHRL